MNSERYMTFGWLFGMAALVLSACGWDNTEDTGDDGADSALYIPRSDLATMNALKTPTGKTYIVRQTPMLDSSLANIQVDAIGFGADTLTFDFGEVDPLMSLHTEDLDRDGFQELYVVTQSVGPEKYGTILGLYSAQDSSVLVISFEGASPYTMKEGEPYAGYGGQDVFRFERGVLTNKFTLFDPDKPTGDFKTLRYELVRGATAMKLRPVRR